MLEESSLSKEIIDFFMSIPIFGRINAEEIKVIARHISRIELEPGAILFKESDKGRFVCFIETGELDVIKKSSSSAKEVRIAILKPGQSIGEMSIIDDFPRSATIKAREKCALFILSKSAFDLILERHSKIGIKLLKGITRLLSGNLRKTSSRLADFMPPLG